MNKKTKTIKKDLVLQHKVKCKQENNLTKGKFLFLHSNYTKYILICKDWSWKI